MLFSADVVRAKACTPSWITRLMSTSSQAPRGFIEVREYFLKPEGMQDFLKLADGSAGLRKHLLPFLGMFTCDVGGNMNRVVHFYSYPDFDTRDKVRSVAAANKEWQQFISDSRKHVVSQTSRIMLEAVPVYDALNIPPTGQYKSPEKTAQDAGKVIYELRNYQLHPGYGSVPKLLEAFRKGLPDKVAADPEGGQLVFFGHTDVGMLNNVMELWRYSSAQACIRARQAARTVPTWRETIGSVTPGVQHFTSEFLHPTAFSNWQ